MKSNIIVLGKENHLKNTIKNINKNHSLQVMKDLTTVFEQ
tara:strand:- start:142 stop:261 length:120 start_codon:yes stop_codon:yes gene_type:complete